ncbi:hypothetical protein P4S64_15095 [Vibrio sp. M60_M31a]
MPVRADQNTLTNIQSIYIVNIWMSPLTAMSDRVEIYPLNGYSKDKYELDDDRS